MEVLSGILLFCFAVFSIFIGSARSSVLNVVDFGATGDGQTDDSMAFLQAWKALCGAAPAQNVPILMVPAGKTFLLQPVEFSGPCSSSAVSVQVLGNIVAPRSIDAWKFGQSESWLSFSHVLNLTIFGTGQIDGQGSAWWSHSQSNDLKVLIYFVSSSLEVLSSFSFKYKLMIILKISRKLITRITIALHFNQCNNLTLTGLTHINSPKSHISLSGCTGVMISHLNIIAPKESPNTDGIDVSRSSHVKILHSNIATGDDCVAINGNSSNIRIIDVVCGPGHGISVGSLGANGCSDTVEEVHVQNCTFNGTQNGVRIKTWQGGQGFARLISFEHITLIASKNPIIIDQYYCDGKHDCKNETTAVSISDVTYSDVRGTSAQKEAIRLDCSEIGCTNVVMTGIYITPSGTSVHQTDAYCQNVKGTFNNVTPDVNCLSGSS
ncbi:probable polygalacturonase At3g15720 [Ricinus communis]|uniref:probable polygalacturonase At3g15720 n=1 Tax=Ricinus communis TaxID=3988 RepID=UPI00201A9887|nr:probable polygalacturonase At3g15720 [Ricinus communis]